MREEQEVLEHDADRAALGRDVRVAAGVVEHRRRRARSCPSAGASRPAIVATSVDLPEPFGPSSATVSPAAASNAAPDLERRLARIVDVDRQLTAVTARNRPRSARITPNAIAMSSIEIANAASWSVCRRSKTASGRVWVLPCRFPANVIVAPNSPSARAHDRTRAAAICGAISGSVTRRSTYQRERAERGGGVLETLVEPPQPRLEREHRERERHEGGGEHRGPGRERDLDAEPVVEPGPDDPPSSERRQERDAGHDRRHHERKDDERAHSVLPRNAPRASTQASGNPVTNEMADAAVATTSESRSAVEDGLARQDLADAETTAS